MVAQGVVNKMIDDKIYKYLNELTDPLDDVSGFVNGMKHWLDAFEEAYNYGNFKLCKQLLNNIDKEVKKEKSSLNIDIKKVVEKGDTIEEPKKILKTKPNSKFSKLLLK